MSKSSDEGFAHIILMIILVGGLVAGLYLVQNVTKFFPKAFDSLSGPVTPSPIATATPDPDSDQDGWTDVKESFIGTDKLDGCADNIFDNAWPPDLNNDRVVSYKDMETLQNFESNKSRGKRDQTSYNKRYDLNTDGLLDTQDLSLESSYLGRTCANPTPIPTVTPTSQPSATPRRGKNN